ncbi:helix-turn-helix domain-containing protein [Salarchaeum sp. III]|uniref:helix-turn-helix domain-containing protein n=1 Tax=Salarchaeum sp. III TaxID=3107927 RepID=UPI002ED8EA5D
MSEADDRYAPPPLPGESLLDLDDYLAMQRVIGDSTRYRILTALLRNGESSASALADALDVPSNRLHYHLDTLQDVGLVQNRKRKDRGENGVHSYYVATGLAETLLEHGVAELISRERELLDRYA